MQKTKGGIMIPEKAQGKVNQAVVVAIGPGAKDKVCLHFLIDTFESLYCRRVKSIHQMLK